MKSQVEEREREESVWDEEAHTQLAVCLVFLLKKNNASKIGTFLMPDFNKKFKNS